jgi:hypothetical protein
MALQAVEIEDILICGFLLVPSATYRLFKIQRWDSPVILYCRNKMASLKGFIPGANPHTDFGGLGIFRACLTRSSL